MSQLSPAWLLEIGVLRPIDRHFADAVLPNGDPLCASVIAMASRFLGEGHSCLPLGALAEVIAPDSPARPLFPDAATVRRVLGQCGAVAVLDGASAQSESSPAAAHDRERLRSVRPLVLDFADRLYLRRYHEHELRLARSLRVLLGERRQASHPALDEFFPPRTSDPDQRAAAAAALEGGLTVISGGPGTGKTSTVVRILGLLVRSALDDRRELPRIALLAPTGKAAARLTDSIRSAKEHLALTEELFFAIPENASTIHRALGVRLENRSRFVRDRSCPLDADVVVVDEASMIDLSLMRHLVDAVRPGAGLILLGDRDQLASVEAGSVLSELADVMKDERAGGGGFVQLTRSYRFDKDSGIFALAQAIRRGEAGAAVEVLRRGGADVAFSDGSEHQMRAALRRAAIEGFRGALQMPTPTASLCALEGFRVLCAHRTGPQGVLEVNRAIESWLQDEGVINLTSEFYAGRLLMVTQNDPAVSLFNGDVGLVWTDGNGGILVYFPRPDGPPRAVSPAELPAHETAFAMTIHKSQGSEYGHVCVALPDARSPLLSRELLYTAVTRAKHRVSLFGTADAVEAGIRRQVRRHSGLGDALG